MAKPPPPPPPAPAQPKGKSPQAVYRQYINAHPALKPYAQAIAKWAATYGLDPVYFAALINFESKGDPNVVSSAGAVGLGQVTPGKTPPWLGRAVTAADLKNPGLNLRVAAWYFSQGLRRYGSYEATYNQYYNPGYGPGYSAYQGSAFASVPKGYVPTGTSRSPEENASVSVETSTSRANITDPFVTIRNGRLVPVTNANNAIKYQGAPQRRSSFTAIWQRYNDLWLAYLGRPIGPKELTRFMNLGWSQYQIVNNYLVNRPNFTNSPVWKQNAPGYTGVWQQIYGANATPDKEAIKYAIVNNLGGDGFATYLRARPDYTTSNEFKTNEASLSTVYTKIYGVPDQQGTNIIQQATLGGWSQDQFATWLRKQPEYSSSGEYQGKALYFAQQLGLVTGDVQPVLRPGYSGPNTGGTNDPMKNDPRAAAAGNIPTTNDLAVQRG
jgi:hypothetical protein